MEEDPVAVSAAVSAAPGSSSQHPAVLLKVVKFKVEDIPNGICEPALLSTSLNESQRGVFLRKTWTEPTAPECTSETAIMSVTYLVDFLVHRDWLGMEPADRLGGAYRSRREAGDSAGATIASGVTKTRV